MTIRNRIKIKNNISICMKTILSEMHFWFGFNDIFMLWSPPSPPHQPPPTLTPCIMCIQMTIFLFIYNNYILKTIVLFICLLVPFKSMQLLKQINCYNSIQLTDIFWIFSVTNLFQLEFVISYFPSFLFLCYSINK